MRLRQAFRALRATPGITISSVVILALGIGASTTVFSVVNGLLLRPLAVTDQGRLFFISKNDVERGFEHYALLYPEYEEWSRRSREFESLAAVAAWGPTEGLLVLSGEPTRLAVSLVSGNFFDVLGSKALWGRTLRSADDNDRATPALVLSHKTWRDRFGSNPSVVGSLVRLRVSVRTSFQVVGVMPEAFDLFAPASAWAPVMAVQPEWAGNRGCECDLIGRLAWGATPESALGELQAIHETLASEEPDRYRSTKVTMVPLLQSVAGSAGRTSLLAFGAAGLLLTIAIVNAAGLAVIRGLSRAHEVAIRTALGARTASLLFERLTEIGLMSVAAVAGGFVLAHLGIDALLFFKGADLPRIREIEIDSRALVFGVLIATVATLVCASIPAIFGVPESLRSRRFASQERALQLFVVGEIALALPLLFASALLVRSLLASASIDRGFRSQDLLTVEVEVPTSKYPDPESRMALFEELLHRVEAIPGVSAVTTLRLKPGTGWAGVSGPLAFEGQSEVESARNPFTNIDLVSPNYFSVLGIPILRGRAFSPFDRLSSERVAIVSEDVSKAYWPGEDPIGKTLGFRDARARVVGVAGNTRYRELTRPWPTVYYPLRQNPFSSETQAQLHPLLTPRGLALKTEVPPEALVSPIRDVIRGLDDEIPLDRVAMMDDLLDVELRAPRFQALATSSFSLIALVLCATGVFSVFAAFVAQRLPEFGIRSALGATPARLRSLVLNRSWNLVVAGILFGGIAAWWLSRFLGAFLYGVAPFDVPTLVGATALLALVSLLATAIPAQRAARVDPLSLLKHE